MGESVWQSAQKASVGEIGLRGRADWGHRVPWREGGSEGLGAADAEQLG